VLLWLMNIDFAGGGVVGGFSGLLDFAGASVGQGGVAQPRHHFRRAGRREWILPFIKLWFGG